MAEPKDTNSTAIIPARIVIPVEADWSAFDRSLEERKGRIDEMGKGGTDGGGGKDDSYANSIQHDKDMALYEARRTNDLLQLLIDKIDRLGSGGA